MTDPTLGSTVRSGARLTLATQTITQVGSILATVALARLLTPGEIGLVAGVQTIMGITALTSATGLSAALITRRGEIGELASSYFWAMILLGSALAGTISLLARPLTHLIGLPDASLMLMCLAAALPLGLATQVPQTLIQRNLQFGRLMAAVTVPAIVFYITEVALAALGFGAWSIIIGQLTSTVIGLGLGLILARWNPIFVFKGGAIRQDLGLMGGISLSQFFSYLHKNLDFWAVGRTLGADSLGKYYIAYVLPNILRLRLSSVFRVVLLPVLAQSKDAGVRRDQWRKALVVTLFVGVPTLAGISAVAHPMVLVFFGDQWTQITVPVQVLMVGSIADIIINAVGTLAIAERTVAKHTALLGVRVLLTAAGVLLAVLVWPTLTGVATAVTVAALVTLILQHFMVSRPLHLSLRPALADITLIVMMTAVMGIVASSTVLMAHSLPPAIQLLMAIPGGMVSYILTGLVLNRSSARRLLRECLRLARG